MTKLQGVFTENLKNARKKANLTQEALAEKVGLTAKHIGVIERGIKFPTIQMIESLADALGIPAYELFIEPSGVAGTSPTEIINNYNKFLVGHYTKGLREAGNEFLGKLDEKNT
jgi:transcriptional regulator with XRE-family HTH domain